MHVSPFSAPRAFIYSSMRRGDAEAPLDQVPRESVHLRSYTYPSAPISPALAKLVNRAAVGARHVAAAPHREGRRRHRALPLVVRQHVTKLVPSVATAGERAGEDAAAAGDAREYESVAATLDPIQAPRHYRRHRQDVEPATRQLARLDLPVHRHRHGRTGRGRAARGAWHPRLLGLLCCLPVCFVAPAVQAQRTGIGHEGSERLHTGRGSAAGLHYSYSPFGMEHDELFDGAAAASTLAKLRLRSCASRLRHGEVKRRPQCEGRSSHEIRAAHFAAPVSGVRLAPNPRSAGRSPCRWDT